MRSLDALIRLARFKVEELQKQMASLDEARGALQRQIDQLSASVPEEQVAASASKDGFLAYGSYAQAVIQRRANLRASVTEVETQAERLRAALADAFRELKKFETMEERRRASERQERRTREQARLDDIANIRAAG